MFMRSTSALYRCACEEEGCVSNTELVKLFHGVDVALQTTTAAAVAAADALQRAPSRSRGKDDQSEENAAISPLPPVLTDSLLIAFQPCLRYPTHIVLSRTYLGDAGTAAFFRVLPMLRWLRVVDARGVGAGARSVDALCGALTAYLVEGCEEAPVVRPAEREETDAGGRETEATHPLAGRLPALELLDLCDNNAIFTLSVEKLLGVLLQRRATLLRWCAKERETDPDAVVLPALEVYVDAANLLPSAAHALQAWNAQAATIKQRRKAAADERRWKEQLKLYTVPGEKTENHLSVMQPVGENVVFRLPLENEEEDVKEEEREDNKSLTRMPNILRKFINAYMPQFLSASCMLAPFTATTFAGPSLYAAAYGARAALQACADFGVDTLDILFYSNAALWYATRIQQQKPQQENACDVHQQMPSSADVNVLEAQRNITVLLRTLDTYPVLYKELLSSPAAGGVVVERHLRRLRELHDAANKNGQRPLSHQLPEEAVKEMASLYYRVVAALVTPCFSAEHLPSMMACEQHIEEVVQCVLADLVVGAEDVERLAVVVRRLRGQAHEDVSLPVKSDREVQSGKRRTDDNMVRLLPPIMAMCFYYTQDHHDAEEAWKQTYAGTSKAAASVVEDLFATLPEVPAPMQTFHTCHCAETLENNGTAAAAADPDLCKPIPGRCPTPCTTCSYRALTSVQASLRDAQCEGDELLFRWKMLEPVRQALPRELRMFFLDMMVRQRSRAQGGCAYMPPLDSLAMNGCERESAERWSMMSWLACSHHHEEYWAVLLRAYAQWYRLRALEFYGQPEAQRLLCICQ